MTTKAHRAIFWTAIAAAALGIFAFTLFETWTCVALVGAAVTVAAFAGEASGIYEQEGLAND